MASCSFERYIQALHIPYELIELEHSEPSPVSMQVWSSALLLDDRDVGLSANSWVKRQTQREAFCPLRDDKGSDKVRNGG